MDKGKFFLLSVIYAFIFSASKLILLIHITTESQGLYGLVALAPYLSVPGLLSSDILLGFSVALISLLSIRAARLVVDAILVFYTINTHFANLFGAYIDLRLLDLDISYGDLKDSILAEVSPTLLLFLVILMLLHRVLANRLEKPFRKNKLLINFLAVVLLAGSIGVRFVFLPTRFPQFRANPIEAILTSIIKKKHISGVYVVSNDFIQKSPYPGHSAIDRIKFRPLKKRLNVILFQMESTGSIAVRRKNQCVMPFAKKLAQNGITWDSFYVPVPMTIKTYYSLQCGVYPGADMKPITTTNPRIPCKGIAEFFSENGYRTALFHGGNFSFTHKLAFLLNRGWDVLYDAKTLPNRNQYEQKAWGIDDKALFDTAKKWILNNDTPFFILIAPILPHHPYDTPTWWTPPFPTEKKIDKYHNSVRYEDELLGGLIAFLKEINKFEDTLFILVGDHGEAFSRHHPFNTFHPIELYEENIKVPFILSNPSLFPDSIRSDQIGILPDLLPTILDLLNFNDCGYDGDGVSLFNSTPDRVIYFHTTFNEVIHGLRDGHFKFIYRPQKKSKELYDLKKDPQEQHNIADDFPDRVRTYTNMVKKWARYSHKRIQEPQ